MPEPIIDRLSQFTPNGSSLDRDALLFAAGRASVHPNRGWMALAGMLATSQVMTLALFWLRPTPSVLVESSELSSGIVMKIPHAPPDASELGVLNRALVASKDAELPPSYPTDDLVPDEPMIHAFAAPLPEGLD
jgi:hypothetical protein